MSLGTGLSLAKRVADHPFVSLWQAGASAIESQLFVGHRHLLTLPQREAWWWVYNWDVYGVTLLGALLLARVVMLLLGTCLGGATGGKKERVKAA